MDIDFGALTVLLAGRLSAIVPAWFRVYAADGMLRYTPTQGKPGLSGGDGVGTLGSYMRDNFDAHGDLAAVAAQVLDELQDIINEATHDPWPGERTPPRACASIRGEALHLWYGEPQQDDHIVVACDPIPLTSIQRGTAGPASIAACGTD
jgi:hypothetical protein